MSHIGYHYLPEVHGMHNSNSKIISEIIRSDGEKMVSFESGGQEAARSEGFVLTM